MDSQQNPTVCHRELCSKLCGNMDGKGVWERIDTCKCMAESLCCPPETIITWLISYIPVQKVFKNWVVITSSMYHCKDFKQLKDAFTTY